MSLGVGAMGRGGKYPQMHRAGSLKGEFKGSMELSSVGISDPSREEREVRSGHVVASREFSLRA